LFPWVEYIVRFGWCPDGRSVWVQFLDRPQRRTAIVKIPISNFMSSSEYEESGGELDDLCISRIEIIFEETSDVWINVTNIFYFFNDGIYHNAEDADLSSTPTILYDQQTSSTKLFITSEKSGYRHLYLVEKPSAESPDYYVRSITTGNWPIVDRPIYVDTKKEIVYFTARKDTPLETHLYAASYAENADPLTVIRLTELGYSHTVVMDSKCE
ncbi:5274_t:CDS:2, partial [Acaulospora morrowiae]